MNYKDIIYYAEDKSVLSLRNITLYKGKKLEDIFYAVHDAIDFEDVTDRLSDVIQDDFKVDRITKYYIRYKVLDVFGNINYLKVTIPNKA